MAAKHRGMSPASFCALVHVLRYARRSAAGNLVLTEAVRSDAAAQNDCSRGRHRIAHCAERRTR
jgi:hypothetical protein